MTFKTTVRDTAGNPIPDVLVTANDEINGESFQRSTDGAGYADVAMLGTCHVGDRVTLSVLDPQMRFKGDVQGDALVVTSADQIISVSLQPFKHASALPAPPTRDQLCGVRCTFQGLTVQTQQYGSLPWFEPALGWLALPTDRIAVYDVKAAAGDTHVNLALAGAYTEPGQAYEHVAGRDYSDDLPAFRALVTEVILAGVARGLPNGFMILLALAGDGMNPDPVGLTKGHGWLMDNFSSIWGALRGDAGAPDLTPWILPMPGYDGVVPGWQPWSCVDDWLRYARSVVGPNGSLALELSAGYWAWSGERDDYATEAGLNLDTVLYEFPYPMGPPGAPPADFTALTNEQRKPWDAVWQVSKRLLGSLWRRPSEQPADDDPGMFHDLVDRPRGPLMKVAFEYDTYGHVRGLPRSIVEAHRTYLKSIGWTLVG